MDLDKPKPGLIFLLVHIMRPVSADKLLNANISNAHRHLIEGKLWCGRAAQLHVLIAASCQEQPTQPVKENCCLSSGTDSLLHDAVVHVMR